LNLIEIFNNVNDLIYKIPHGNHNYR
jgi:hypothetical protein